MAIADFYMEIVAFTKQGKTATEVTADLIENHGAEFTRGAVNSALRKWEQAGAFIVHTEKVQNAEPTVGGPADGYYGYHREYRFYSNAVALQPGVLARAIGVERANAILIKLGQPTIMIEPTPRRVSLQPAIVEAPQQPQLFEDEPPAAETNGKAEKPPLPSLLFGAQFTMDGVLITYEQFHRVVALLQHATEDQRG